MLNDPYFIWARILVDCFFGEDMIDRKARLMIDRELLDEKYPHLGGSGGFIATVRAGPLFLKTEKGFHRQAKALGRLWSRQALQRPDSLPVLPDDAPPYLPHLAALCLAWTIDEEGLQANSFYNRLSLVIPEHELSPNLLAEWRPLWVGLEKWSKSLEGRRGIYQIESLGGMAHVGIPRSQVILTPSKIARLPDLFVATGLAVIWESVNDQSLRITLLGHEGRTRVALGNPLYEEILNQSDIGQATLSRLLEFLREPGYRSASECGTGRGPLRGGQIRNTAVEFQIRLILERSLEIDSWSCRFGLLGVDPPQIEVQKPGWQLHRVDRAFGGLWLAGNELTNGAFIDAGRWGRFSAGFHLSLNQISGVEGEECMLSFPDRKVRVFSVHWFVEQWLAEADELPAEGGCFLLVTSEAQTDFTGWRQQFEKAGGRITDYTDQGLPSGVTLFYAEGFDLLDQGLKQNFPEPSLVRSTQKVTLLLRGGSRVASIGANNLYLPYDPPDLIFISPLEDEIVCKGAELTELPYGTSKIPDKMPGVPVRQYQIQVHPETTLIELITLSKRVGFVTQRLAIGISRDVALGAAFSEDLSPRFGRFGRRIDGYGILGSQIDREIEMECILPPWRFEQRRFEIGIPVRDEDVDHPGWKLCESLLQKRRLNSQEFRRRVERILDWWSMYAWNEARWLRGLSHIEIERDNRGRIAYIYPVQSHGYLLPWKDGDRWIVAIGGCPNSGMLGQLIEAGEALDLEILVTERSSPLLPPRWLCLSDDLDAIALALDDAGMRFDYSRGLDGSPIPLCAKLADWAGNLEGCLSELPWLEGVFPEGVAEFSPYLLRMTTDDDFHCPYRLISVADGLSPGQKRSILHDGGGVCRPRRHSFLVDPSWGKWKCASVAALDMDSKYTGDDSCFPLPIDGKQSLYVPASLIFPTILTKALLTASALSPVSEWGTPYYSEGSKFLPVSDRPYRGACHRYASIPSEVAKIVCQKVEAHPFAMPEA